MQPRQRLSRSIFTKNPRDQLNQFLAIGLESLKLAFGLLFDHCRHRNPFSSGSCAHLQVLQNQAIIIDNHSITPRSEASILPLDQAHASLLVQSCWTFLQGRLKRADSLYWRDKKEQPKWESLMEKSRL